MSNWHNDKKVGRLEIICGSMFSGKTEELMRRLKRAELARQRVLTIKHHMDQRKDQSVSCIWSHEGREREAHLIGDQIDDIGKILILADQSVEVIGIDEVQFFIPQLVEVIAQLVFQGKRVITAGLDLDFRGEPFGIMPKLMALADDVTKLKAICVSCGKDAHHTQRLINGKPAHFDDPIILVGETDYYEARCRTCFCVDRSDRTTITASKRAPGFYTDTRITG